MKVKTCDMTKLQWSLVGEFKLKHDIVDPIKEAKFFWNAQEQKLQVVEVVTMQHPFKKSQPAAT